MKLLLDTHILLWAVEGSRHLSSGAKRLISEADQVHVSSVSLWEASIKVTLGKLKVDMDRLEDNLRKLPFLPLPVKWAHASAMRRLPMLHRDPFDRMLVAQSLHEGLALLTHDDALAPYSPMVLVV